MLGQNNGRENEEFWELWVPMADAKQGKVFWSPDVWQRNLKSNRATLDALLAERTKEVRVSMEYQAGGA
jgi:hypothetical protein